MPISPETENSSTKTKNYFNINITIWMVDGHMDQMPMSILTEEY
jgi:hypothetical protein